MEIYTLKDMAKKLKVSERTIFRYLDKHKLSGSKIGQWRFTEKDLEEFINKNKNKK
jgi:excisionase family DNA binding protein